MDRYHAEVATCGGVSLPIAIACGGLVVIFLFWTLPIFIRGWKILLGRAQTRLETQVLGGYVLVVIALFLGITYILSADLSIASRYHFVYFPAFIIVIAAALAVCWDANNLVARTDLDLTNHQQMLRFLQIRGKKQYY